MKNTCAIIVGPPGGACDSLMHLADAIGFSSVLAYSGLARLEEQTQGAALSFFLFVPLEDVRALRPTADSIRFSPRHRVRFSPMIYFCDTPSVETIKGCINMGFDDVIALPFTAGKVEERLVRQVGTPQVYYETSGYFGPDRRRHGLGGETMRDKRGGGGQYRRLEILRDTATGISVTRDDFFQNA